VVVVVVAAAAVVIGWVMCTVGGSEKSKVGIAGDSGGGTISSTVAHEVPGLAFEVYKLTRQL